MHLYNSGERLKENINIAKGEQLKFSAWDLPCSSHCTLYEGYGLGLNLPFTKGISKTLNL